MENSMNLKMNIVEIKIKKLFLFFILLIMILSKSETTAKNRGGNNTVYWNKIGYFYNNLIFQKQKNEIEKTEEFEQDIPERVFIIEDCTVTWYTADTCGKSTDDKSYGITASGQPVKDNWTCAVDNSVIPMYSQVFVKFQNGEIKEYYATDTGVKGEWVDIYVSNYDQAIENGLQRLDVYFVPPFDNIQ